jgi:hypothetical protein
MSFGHGGLASAAGSTPAADTGSSLVDNDRGRHSSPIVIGAPRSKQSGVLRNEIDVGCLSWLQEDGSPTRIERVSIFDLRRGEKISSGKVMPLFSRIDQVQLVRLVAAKPELIRDELILDHSDLDASGTRPINGRGRVDMAGNNKSTRRN